MIWDDKDNRIDGASITLWDAATGKGLKTTSRAGHFTFPGMPEGRYLIKIEKNDLAFLYGALTLEGDVPHEYDPVVQTRLAETDPVVGAGGLIPKPKATPTTPSHKPRKVKAAHLIKQVTPVYPQSASQARISGKVTIDATLRTDGTLDDMVVTSAPHKELAFAALVAVRDWKYSPTLLDGKAVEVRFTIDVNFKQ